MPILWPGNLQQLLDHCSDPITKVEYTNEPTYALPPNVGGMMPGHSELRNEGLLYRQKKNRDADWKIVSKVFSDKTLTEYTYYWLIVNTRCFYFDALGGQVPKSRDDRMVLCPFVDYFNHSDHGVSV